MIFERNGQKLTKEYFARLATDCTNEFLGRLGLENKIEIYPQEILTDPNEAMQYFDRVRFFQPQKPKKGLIQKISNLIQRIPIGRRKSTEKKSLIDDLKENSISILPSLEGLIRTKEPFFYPYSLHTNNGVIYVPLLEGREDQWRYWIENGLFDFVSREVIIILGTAADKKGASHHTYKKTRLRRYLSDERRDDPRRETSSEGGGKDNWYYQGASLPNNTFTLPSLVSMGMYRVLENLYLVTDENVGRVFDLLAVTYSLYKALPILSKNFTIYDFPKKWIEIYKNNMLEITYLKRWDNPPNLSEVEELIHQIGACINGNLNRGLKLMGDALKKGVKDYSGMVDFLAEKSKQTKS